MSTSSTPTATPKPHFTPTHTPTPTPTTTATPPHKRQHSTTTTPKPTAGSLRAAAVSEKQQKRQAQANDSQRSKKRQKRQDQRNTYKVAVDSPYHVSINAVTAEQTEHVLQLLQHQFQQLHTKLSAVRKQITSARHTADLQRQAAEGAAAQAQKVNTPSVTSNAITIDVDNPSIGFQISILTQPATAIKTKAQKREQRLERKQRPRTQKHEVQRLVAAELGTARHSGVLLGLNEVTTALTQLQQQNRSCNNSSTPAEPSADATGSRLLYVIAATQNLPAALLQHLPVQCCLTQTPILPLACTNEKLGELLGLQRCIAVGVTAASVAGQSSLSEIAEHARIPVIPWLHQGLSPDARYATGELVEQYPKR